MTIAFLLVDDSATDCAATAELLRRAMPGAQLLTADGGEAALTLLEERRLVPSLVFTDIAMPNGGGLELIAGIRQTRWLAGTPVVVVSKPATDKEMMTAYRLGACAVLAKPARLHELREVIRDHAQPAKLMASGAIAVPDGAIGVRRSAA